MWVPRALPRPASRPPPSLPSQSTEQASGRSARNATSGRDFPRTAYPIEHKTRNTIMARLRLACLIYCCLRVLIRFEPFLRRTSKKETEEGRRGEGMVGE